jgi:hypothetical protein
MTFTGNICIASREILNFLITNSDADFLPPSVATEDLIPSIKRADHWVLLEDRQSMHHHTIQIN